MDDFKEPKPNAIVGTICKILFPFWLRIKEHLSISVRGDQADLDAFSKNRRAVVLLNHPDRQDPFVIFELAKKMREEFYCIAARECFDWDGGWRGWLFQSLGCYSVARGKADFHSIATTKKILLEGQRKLIVFPEAEITADEFTIHELHKAIFHIALSVQHDLIEGKSSNSNSPLVLIPAAIKFSLDSELEPALEPCLFKMEDRLNIRGTEASNVYVRIHGVVEEYLTEVFEAYGLEKPEADLRQLAEHAATAMLRKIAQSVGTDFNDELSAVEQLYTLRNKIHNKGEIESVAVLPNAFFCLGIPTPCISSDLERIERLLIMERMLEHPASKIQCCRILDFIECELFGLITPKGKQSSAILIGTPLDISAFVKDYADSKEETVTRLSEHFKQTLQKMLLDERLSGVDAPN